MMLDEIRERQRLRISAGKKVWERLEIQTIDAENMEGIPDNSTSHVLAGYLMYGVSDHKKLLSEAKRTMTPDGVFGYSVNTVAPWVTILRQVSNVRPDKIAPYPPAEWHTQESNTKVMEDAGFKDIKTKEVDIDMWYNSYEGVVDYLLDMMPFMPMLLAGMTEEEMAKFRDHMIAQLMSESPTLPGKFAGKAMLVTGRK
ncbi:hypothetical protein GE09DRAFT_1137688 [Coniochaeta sp. 2T2.1]|nr:hypothetical protein GE09DRAFT_1137688 [Coniochaeta sp. 2T2.1]